MNKISNFLFNRPNIPPEWWNDFLSEWNFIVYGRARAVAWVTLIYPVLAIPSLSLLHTQISHPRLPSAPWLISGIQICTFLVSAYLLFGNPPPQSPEELSDRHLKSLNAYLIGLAVFFDAIFAIIWTATGLNPPYLIGLFVYTSLFYRPSRRNMVYYLGNFAFYLIYISQFDFPTSTRAVACVSGVFASIVALIIANSLFDSKIKNFVNRRTIEQQTEALKNANARLNLLANLDGLTHIANRRQFDHHFEQQWTQLGRSNSSLTILICDVDHFKLFNDRYGHQAGDQCLKEVATTIENCVERNGDLVARYGGEEFAVILPNTGREGAIAIAQKICTAVQNLGIKHEQSSYHQVTISVGAASVIPHSQILAEKLINSADQALYDAKQNGRNQFSYFEFEQSSYLLKELKEDLREVSIAKSGGKPGLPVG